jgi:hypothetical protein
MDTADCWLAGEAAPARLPAAAQQRVIEGYMVQRSATGCQAMVMSR